MNKPQTRARVLSFVAALFAAFSIQAAPLITSLVETGGDGAPTAQWTGNTFTGPAIGTYTVPTFNLLSKSFCDRVHAWTNASATVPLPPYLVNNPYIMIRNDNRENTGYRLDVTVSEDVLVYLLIDNRNGDTANGDPPFNPNPVTSWPNMQWVGTSGFRPVTTGQNRTANMARPDEISIDESADGTRNQYFSIYSNRFPAGTFTLLQQGFANNMYGVVLIGVGPTAPPPAPTNVVAAGLDGQAAVSWATTREASGYNVKRSSTPGGPYTTVGTTASTSLVDPGLVNGTPYYYVVSATNSLGESPDSLEAVAIPNPVVTGIVAIGGTNQVVVSWNDLEVAESYSVLRATAAAGPYTTLASALVTTTYTDLTAEAGRTYYYRVSAPLIGGGTSGQSAAVPATTIPLAPSATASLFAATTIAIQWTSNSAVISHFLLEQSLDGSTFTPLATLAGNLRGYTNSGLAPATTYFYRVQATNAGGYSEYSAVVSNTTPAWGINVNFANGAAATPVGYVQDIGELFGDRTNGWFYGWTNSANTNITVDARLRNSANSPDLRYDTLMHLMRANVNDPSLGAVWDIAVPNGQYLVRIVSGDPDNADEILVFDVEGVITPSYNANGMVGLARFADMTVSCGVSDGRLTIKSAPGAVNSKICFIDIYRDTPVAPAFATNIQSQSVEEWRPFALAPVVTGSQAFNYQWYFNDAPVLAGTNRVLDLGRIREANEGSYYLVVTNYGGVATSDVAVITVNPDTLPPQIASVSSLDGFQIGVTFNEDINTNAPVVIETFYYLVNAGGVDVEVSQVIIRPDGRSVALKLNTLTPIAGSFTVDAANIPDYQGNFDDSTVGTGTVLGFAAQDIGAVGVPGSHFTSDGSRIEIVGSGTDIWNAADQGYMATKTITGDFDLRIRVDSLTRPDNITKAVVIARETTNTDSRTVHVSLNPPTGRNQTQMGLRSVTAGATATVGATYTGSNSWIRLSRLGDTFTGYRSPDGLTWFAIASTNVVFAPAMEIGFGITSHTNTILATGVVSNVRIDQSFVDLQLGMTASPETTVTVGNNVTYTIGVFNAGAADATAVVVTDLLPTNMTFVSATASAGSCGNVGGTVTCNLGTLIPSGAASITIVATATATGPATNSASIASATLDTDPSNNANLVVVEVTSGPVQQPITGFGFQAGGAFGGTIQTQPGVTYEVQYKEDLNAATWTFLQTIVGDGTVKPFSDPNPSSPARFYRIIIVP